MKILTVLTIILSGFFGGVPTADSPDLTIRNCKTVNGQVECVEVDIPLGPDCTILCNEGSPSGCIVYC